VVASSSSPGRWPPARAREGWRCRAQWQPVVEGSPSTFSTQIPPSTNTEWDVNNCFCPFTSLLQKHAIIPHSWICKIQHNYCLIKHKIIK
jgi:hypothetical protein